MQHLWHTIKQGVPVLDCWMLLSEIDVEIGQMLFRLSSAEMIIQFFFSIMLISNVETTVQYLV